jgi:glycosyltransferase involved in cell wall biosynthesis
MRIALIFRNFGPYHLARLRALRNFNEVLALEFVARDPEYSWDRKGTSDSIYSLGTSDTPFNLSLQRMRSVLKDFEPDCVAVPGWGERLALHAALTARCYKWPAILMSDSWRAEDDPRNILKEGIKARLLKLFSAALVAGNAHKKYLTELGFPASRIVNGYDVVDNSHFMASSHRPAELLSDAYQHLPREFFLCCARLIEKKNIGFLLKAYLRFKLNSAVASWHLVVAGDGKLRRTLEQQIVALDLTENVHLLGHVPYQKLPALYGLARAFVLPSINDEWGLVVNEAMAAGLPVLVSRRAGAAELVEEGKNGHTFDPCDLDQLVTLMVKIAKSENLADMGRASREIIAGWGPDRFSRELITAGQIAAQAGGPEPSMADVMVARLVAAIP